MRWARDPRRRRFSLAAAAILGFALRPGAAAAPASDASAEIRDVRAELRRLPCYPHDPCAHSLVDARDVAEFHRRCADQRHDESAGLGADVNVTGAMSEAAVEQQRVEYTGIFGKEAADALIDQEYYCRFEAAILGAYWGKEMLLAEQQGRICDVPVNTDLPVHTAWDIGVDDAMAIWCFQVYPDHLDIVDYYEGHGQGFDHYCAWLDERGYHGTDWVPHDAKVREVGAPGARTRIETLVLLGRKPELAPERDADGRHQRRPQDDPLRPLRQEAHGAGPRGLRSYRTEWDEKAQGVQDDARRTTGRSHGADGWRYPVALMARADARAGAREGARRRTAAGSDHGSVHGHRGQLVDAGGEGLATSAMRDGVWDRTASHQTNIKNTAPYDVMTVALSGTSPPSEAIFAFGAYGARGAIATDLQ